MKKPQPNFSMDDLLAEFPELQEGPGQSVQELADKKGLTTSAIGAKLTRLYRAGKLAVSFRKGVNMIGHIAWIPVYTLKEGEKDDVR